MKLTIKILFISLLLLSCNSFDFTQIGYNPNWLETRLDNIINGKDSLSQYYIWVGEKGYPPIDYAEIYESENGIPSNLEDAYFILLNTSFYKSYYINESGEPSSQGIAFELISDVSNSVECYLDLIERANLPGRLYGLKGIKYSDSSLFDNYKVVILEHNDSVWVQYGCVVYKESVKKVIDGM